MSIGTLGALALIVGIVTVYYFIAERGGEIVATGDMTLPQAIVVLAQECKKQVQRYKRKPVRRHSHGHLGKSAIRVTTLQTLCRR